MAEPYSGVRNPNLIVLLISKNLHRHLPILDLYVRRNNWDPLQKGQAQTKHMKEEHLRREGTC